MARLINEGTPQVSISGRIGDIVVVQGKNGPFIRKRPTIKKKAKETESVQRVRNRFAIAANFVKHAASIIRMGVWPKPSYAINQAMSEILRHALVDDGGECFIDYSKVVLSKGTLVFPNKLEISSSAAGGLTLNYESPKKNARGKELIVALYNPLVGWWDMIKAPFLSGTLYFTPGPFDVLEVFAFLRNVDGSNASASRYLGPLSSQK